MTSHYHDTKQPRFECDFCGKNTTYIQARADGWHRMTTFNNVRDFCPKCWEEVGETCCKQAQIGQYVVSGLVQ